MPRARCLEFRVCGRTCQASIIILDFVPRKYSKNRTNVRHSCLSCPSYAVCRLVERALGQGECKLFSQIAATDTVDARQVRTALRMGESRGLKQGPDGMCLILPMFLQQRAAGLEMPGCCRDQAAQVVQTVRTCCECGKRRESHIPARQMGIGGGDIGRVADYEVEAASGQCRKPVAGQKFDRCVED